jgi:hypothetical protein
MRKTLMYAFLALSLLGGQLSAYPTRETVTPSKIFCALKKNILYTGKSDEELKSKVEEYMKNGIKDSKYGHVAGHFVYDPESKTFKNQYRKATFSDILSDWCEGRVACFAYESKLRAIEQANDECASAVVFN